MNSAWLVTRAIRRVEADIEHLKSVRPINLTFAAKLEVLISGLEKARNQLQVTEKVIVQTDEMEVKLFANTVIHDPSETVQTAVDAAMKLAKQFFPSEKMTSAVEFDPEVPMHWQMVVTIHTKRQVDDVIERMNQFDEVWLPTLDQDLLDIMVVTVEFI